MSISTNVVTESNRSELTKNQSVIQSLDLNSNLSNYDSVPKLNSNMSRTSDEFDQCFIKELETKNSNGHLNNIKIERQLNEKTMLVNLNNNNEKS